MITDEKIENLFVAYLKDGFDDIMDFFTYVWMKTGEYYNG